MNDQIIGGDSSLARDVRDDEFSWRVPAADTDQKAILEFSYNKMDWQQVVP